MERFLIRRESDISIAVVGVQAMAKRQGFDTHQISKLATAVSELATNIHKYSCDHGGDILAKVENKPDQPLKIEIQARDNGPGITNLEEALLDHYSSSGTLGLGLPGVKRISDEFHIVTKPGEGTIVSISIHQSL
ncbi:MAG: ATP-binding protein [Synechococcus sp. WH 8007]|nr:ATP-binding protein [Synechococcus sp. WH 8007]